MCAKNVMWPVMYFEERNRVLEASNFTDSLSKGHVIHMVVLVSKHLHNKKQGWIVRKGKQFLMEMQTRDSFLNNEHKLRV